MGVRFGGPWPRDGSRSSALCSTGRVASSCPRGCSASPVGSDMAAPQRAAAMALVESFARGALDTPAVPRRLRPCGCTGSRLHGIAGSRSGEAEARNALVNRLSQQPFQSTNHIRSIHHANAIMAATYGACALMLLSARAAGTSHCGLPTMSLPLVRRLV